MTNKQRDRLKLLLIFGITLCTMLLVLNVCANHVTVSTPEYNPNPRESVVKLTIFDGHAGGTGFEVKAPSGKIYTLTNSHICDVVTETNQILYADAYNRRVPMHIIENSATTDLCLLQGLYPTGYEVASQAPAMNDPIDVWGYGLLFPLTHTTGVYVGSVESILKVTTPGYITATVLPGNSGSPALNQDQRVIGVVYATSIDANFRGFIVPLRDILDFLRPY